MTLLFYVSPCAAPCAFCGHTSVDIHYLDIAVDQVLVHAMRTTRDSVDVASIL